MDNLVGTIKNMTFISDQELGGSSQVEKTTEPGPNEQSILGEIGTSLKKRGTEFVGNINEMGDRKINPLEFAVRQIGQTIGGATDIISSVVSPLIAPALKKAFSTPIGQDLAHALTLGESTYNKIKNSSPAAGYRGCYKYSVSFSCC